jgi:hypothetical protein
VNRTDRGEHHDDHGYYDDEDAGGRTLAEAIALGIAPCRPTTRRRGADDDR